MLVNDLRKLLQSKLNTISGLSSGRAKPDDVIEEDEIYYGYELTTSAENYGLEYQYSELSITLTGRLVSKNKSLATIDSYANQIAEVLKELRFRYTIQDVTEYDKINKVLINGHTSLNEVNNYLR
jgi:hypothetical protein